MLFVEGVGFASKAEYEAALEDQKIIKDIKSRFDLTRRADIEKVYSEIRNIHFRTKVGDDFDDYIYELYQKIKDGTFEEPKANTGKKKVTRETCKSIAKSERETRPKSKRETLEHMDDATKAGVLRVLRRRNAIRTVFIILLLGFAAFSIGYFVKYYHDASEIQETADDLSELKENDKIASVISVKPVIHRTYPQEIVIPDILEEYAALYNKNKSMVGWVKIDDTVIDYPVMQTEDNEYYLKHNFDLKNDANGCIFLDAKCDIILGNTN